MGAGVIESMVSALELEIATMKRQNAGITSVEVRGGERKGTTAGHVLYTFRLTEETHLNDDAPVRIEAGQEKVDGTVVSCREGVLIVALERDLGPKIAYARVVSDNSFLLQRLRDRLLEISSGTARFNSKKADQTIGERTCKTSSLPVDEELFLIGEKLNPEQKQCVYKALGSDVVFIWGPPGTGKTTVLACVAEAYYRKGLSVLLVSNTNVAVNTALRKLVDRLEKRPDPGLKRGVILRYGPVPQGELEPYRQDVVLDDVVERLGHGLKEQIVALETEKAGLDRELRAFATAVGALERVQQSEQSLSQLEARFERCRVLEQEARSSLESLNREIESLRVKQERASEMTAVGRLFTGLRLKPLAEALVKAQTKRDSMMHKLDAAAEDKASLADKIKEVREELDEQRRQTASFPPLKECRKWMDESKDKVAKLAQSIQRLHEQCDALRAELLRDCAVLATTVYRTYLKGQVDRPFDVVLIDEASMLMLPMAYYAAGLADKHVVVTGDFRQLPPIVVSEEAEAVEWLKRDVFYKAGIADAVEKGEHPESLVALQDQHRMAETICSIANLLFYDGNLRTSKHAGIPRKRKDMAPWDHELVYVDTTPLMPWASVRLGTYSRYNLFHALLVRNLLLRLDDCGALGNEESVGIVSPYREQTRLIQRLLDESFDERDSILAASTVHRFQGNEKDTMLIELADSAGARASRFVRARSRKEDGARLLNVALSRARGHIVLVANFQWLRHKVASDAILQQILDIFEEKGQAEAAEPLLASGPETWLDALEGTNIPPFDFDRSTAGLFTEGTFYPAFYQDVKNAKESVVVFSPFLTSAGAGRWIEVLRAKAAKGVRVRFVTRPPGNQPGVLDEGLEELIDQIRARGITVDVRANMHEKFAVIDNALLWHGSLNILSHQRTSESMLRIPSKAACSQLGQFVTPFSGGRRPSEEDEQVDLANRENPDCPSCVLPMTWKNGRYGVYFVCDKCGHKVSGRKSGTTRSQKGARLKGKKRATRRRHDQPHLVECCPECGKPLMHRQGRYGPFIGCSGYPRCRYTQSLE